jgi:GNAT superfamily N-acetyltransferase
MDNLLLRDAVLEDLPFLKEFEQEIIKAERPFDPTIRQDPVSYYDLKDYVLRKDVKVVVADVNGLLVASGYALTKKARHYLDHVDYAYLGYMYTKPEFRGKGIIQKIIESLKKWALEQGLNEVRLTVYHDNIPAIKAYEKSGFKSHLNEMRIRLNKY